MLILVPVRIRNANLDPGEPNQCGSMWLRIRIHNTERMCEVIVEEEHCSDILYFFAFINKTHEENPRTI